MAAEKSKPLTGEFQKMNIVGTEGEEICFEASRGDVLDVCKMLDLSGCVDFSILNVPEDEILTLQKQFQIISGDPNERVSFKLTGRGLRNLSCVLEGVNVVDPDDFFGKDAKDIPDDDRMQALTERVTHLYERTCDAKSALD